MKEKDMNRKGKKAKKRAKHNCRQEKRGKRTKVHRLECRMGITCLFILARIRTKKGQEIITIINVNSKERY